MLDYQEFLKSPNHVVGCSPEVLQLLALLFPTYSITQELVYQNFLCIHDVSSQKEMFSIHSYYHNFVIISSKLFDVELTYEDLKELVLLYRRLNFKSRHKTIQSDEELTIDELCSFLYKPEVQQDSDLFELFSAVGTRMFATEFFKACESSPTQVVIKAISTFLSKVSGSPTSLFYKKQKARLYNRLAQGILPATSFYNRIYDYNKSEAELQNMFIAYHDKMFGA